MLDSQGSLFFNASRMARERQERSTRDGTKALTVRSTTQCLVLLRSNVSFGLKREMIWTRLKCQGSQPCSRPRYGWGR